MFGAFPGEKAKRNILSVMQPGNNFFLLQIKTKWCDCSHLFQLDEDIFNYFLRSKREI